MDTTIHKLLILGSGPAGLTAAIYASRANLKPIVIQGNNPGGQLMNTTAVENWPGEKSIMGPQLMIKMMDHAKHFGATLIPDDVASVDFSKEVLTVTTAQGETYSAHSVIIATGADHKKLRCPGEDTYWNKGVTNCAVCDGAFFPDKNVVIIGGGDTAMEDASFLKKFTKKITIIQIQEKLSASYAMQQRVLNDPDITIKYNSAVTEIKGDGEKVTHITIKNSATGTTEDIPADGVFVAIGLNPNTNPFKDQVKCNEYGYIEVENRTRTSVERVFCAGDVHDYHYRQAVTAAGSGCMAALDAERYLSSRGI